MSWIGNTDVINDGLNKSVAKDNKVDCGK